MKLDRRRFLRGLGAGALAFPFVGDTRAWSAPGVAKRLIVFFSGTGMEMKAWKCPGGETDFTFSRTLKPLEPYRNDLLILQGLNMESGYNPAEKVDHDVTTCNVLTGIQIVGKKEQLGGPGIGVGNGISVDQYILDRLPGPRLPSRHLGVSVWEKYGRLSFRGKAQPIFVENDAKAAFQSIFSGVMPGGGAADANAIARLKAEGKSVIDAVRGDLRDLEAQLCGEDRRKLGVHLDSVRDLELRLDSTSAMPSSGACRAPSLVDSAAFPDNVANQMDNLVMAMACGLTRVATLLPGGGSFNMVFSWLPGIKHGFHSLKHRGADVTGLTAAQIDEQLIQINTWYATQFAALLGKLKAIPEPGGEGTMLDNSIVLWTTEHADGAGHEMRDMPFVLAGKAGGYLRPGRLLRFNGTPHNNLLLSLCHAMGVPAETFGDPRFATGPLASLR